jgi:hypothetical protein
MMNACWEQTGGFDALMKYAVFHCTTQSGYEGIINDGLVKTNKPADHVIDAAWSTTGNGVFDFGHGSHKYGGHKIAIRKYYPGIARIISLIFKILTIFQFQCCCFVFSTQPLDRCRTTAHR